MSSSVIRYDPRVVLLVLGVSVGISQAVLLREAMAALGGSELAWGTVMALWLIGMAAGSRVGARFGGPTLAAVLPLATVLLTGVGTVMFRAAPALVGAAPGETLTAWHSAWIWTIAVLPAAAAGGLAFPILAAQDGTGGPGAAYGLEAAGILVGGLSLSLLLAPLGTAAALCLTSALVTAATPTFQNRLLRWAAVAALVAGSLVAGDLLAHAGWRWAGHPGELGHWTETRRQRIEVSRHEPLSLYADGRLAATYPDPYTTVPISHLLMLLHPAPQRVFVVGSLSNGSLVTMARHPVRELLVVEPDPELARRLPAWYGVDLEAALDDPRTLLRTTDPIQALAGSGFWDLIVLLDGNPITVRHGRTRTEEFFRLCRSHLADDGILAVRLEVSDTYLGGSAGRLLQIMVSTVRKVFPQVTGIPGEEVVLVAGGPDADVELDPSTLEERWRMRSVDDRLFAPAMIELLLDTSRADELQRVIDRAAAPANTRDHPRAVLVASSLLEARSQPLLLPWTRALEGRPAQPLAIALAMAVLGLLATAVRRRPPAIATAAVVGASSMGWWLLLMAAWQSTRGSVYAEVGALTAAFMGGLALGSLVAARWEAPAAGLPWVIVAGVALSLVIATRAPFSAPVVTIPVFLVTGGALTGAAFPGIAALAGRGDSRRGAGIGFAADEVGAACAAVVVGILALPWAGLRATALGLAALGLAVVAALLISRRRRGGS